MSYSFKLDMTTCMLLNYSKNTKSAAYSRYVDDDDDDDEILELFGGFQGMVS